MNERAARPGLPVSLSPASQYRVAETHREWATTANSFVNHTLNRTVFVTRWRRGMGFTGAQHLKKDQGCMQLVLAGPQFLTFSGNGYLTMVQNSRSNTLIFFLKGENEMMTEL